MKAPVVLNELAYFPFDETTGTSAVNSVYGRAEAVNFTPTWISGVRQQALELPELLPTAEWNKPLMMTCNWELRISVLSCGSVPTAVPVSTGICSIKAATQRMLDRCYRKVDGIAV